MTPARRRLVVLGAVGATATGLGALVGALVSQSRSGVAALLASSFPDAAGRIWRLSQWQGRPLVCNFWATWCEPCREEMPLLDAAQTKFAVKQLQIVGIAVDNAKNVSDYAAKAGFQFPLLVGQLEAVDLMRELGNTAGALPFTVLLDARGRLRRRKLGAYSAADLDTDLAQLLR